MKFNIKKVATILGSALMIGSTAGLAAAASVPSSFTAPGVAVVYGTGIGANDAAATTAIDADMDSEIGTSGGGSTTETGDSASLSDSSDKIYLGDDITAPGIATITGDDLTNVLTDDGIFEDVDGDEYDYETTVVLGTVADFAFSDVGNELEDPDLVLDLDDSVTDSNYAYQLKVIFNDALNVTDADVKGESITLFGKEYTIGEDSSSTQLVLLGGASSEKIAAGETATLTVGGNSYEVTVEGISDATDDEASITVNGETKTFNEGDTKKVGGVDVYVDDIFRTGDNSGHVVVQIGSDQLTLKDLSKVKVGSSEDNVDGTYVNWDSLTALTSLTISIGAEDSDTAFLLEGGELVDPVFNAVKLQFLGVENGPTIENMVDVSEDNMKIEINPVDDRELELSVGGIDIPFAYQAGAGDQDGTLALYENASVDEDDYIILNKGDDDFYFLRVDTIDPDETDPSIVFYDMMAGESREVVSSGNLSVAGQSKTFNLGGSTYTVTLASSTNIRVTDADTELKVYPWVGLYDGTDHALAITDQVTIQNLAIGTLLQLPDAVYNVTANNTVGVITASAAGVQYNLTAVADTGNVADVTIEMNQTSTSRTNPSIVILEEDDNNDGDVQNAVIVYSTDSGSVSDVGGVSMTDVEDSSTFDDTDYTGYLSAFGTYVLKDDSDEGSDAQTVATITVPKNQMYADVAIAEAGAVSSDTPNLGAVSVKDSEVSSVSGKNLIVVGGSCVNSVAADLLGSACGDSFTAATGVKAGEAIIQSFNRAGKTALLVAGYNMEDTSRAATWFVNSANAVNVTVGAKTKLSTANTAATVISN